MVPILGGAYLFLFAALQSEDYALLIESVGLFAILVIIMAITAKIDWYSVGKQPTEN